jgi:hypothetical protein
MSFILNPYRSFILNPYRFAGYDSIKSLSFDGTNEYLDAGSFTGLTFASTEAFSFSAWVYLDTLGSLRIVASNQRPSPNTDGFFFGTNTSNQFIFYLQGNSGSINRIQLTSTTTISVNTWTHVCATKSTSSAASSVKIYIDNSSDTLTTVYDNLTVNPSVSNMFLGARDRSGAQDFWTGYMDEISFWDKELTSGEVSEIYNSGCPNDLNAHSASGNLVSWWKMGEGDTISTITDQVGSNDGTPANMDSSNLTYSAPCGIYKSMFFDGTNERVDCANDPSLDFDYTDTLSFSCWFYLTNAATSKTMLAKRNTGTPNRGYSVQSTSANQVYVSFINAVGNQLAVEGNTVLSHSTWYHLVVTYDGNYNGTAFKLYINGSSEAYTVIANTLSATISNSVSFKIGDLDSSSYFDGYLDEVSVWDKELSSGEVTELYNLSCVGDLNQHSAVGNIVSWWKMGEDDTISSITDQIGSNDGTPQNMDSTNIKTIVGC